MDRLKGGEKYVKPAEGKEAVMTQCVWENVEDGRGSTNSGEPIREEKACNRI